MHLSTLALIAAALSGTVREAGTGEPIPYAAVQNLGTGATTYSDAKGGFYLAGFEAGRIRVEALGYLGVELVVEPTSAHITVHLEPRPLRAGVLTVPGVAVAAAGPSAWRIRGSHLAQLQHVGERDVLRAVQDLPPVSSFSDFSTGLYVRGGTPDQTGIELDGAPLFNPYHLGGFFSALDPSAVAVAELHATAPPVWTGDRLAGELLITTRDGSRDRWRSSGGVGVATSRIAADGPIGRSTTAMFAIRRTYLGALIGAANSLGLTEHHFPYGFLDFHVKLTQHISDRGALALSMYRNSEGLTRLEALGDSGVTTARWATTSVALNHSHRLAASLTLRNTVAFSSFSAEAAFRGGWRDSVDADVLMRELRLRTAAEWHHRSGRATVGAHLGMLAAEHDISSSGRLPELIFPRMRTDSAVPAMSLFVAEDAAIARSVRIHAGLRLLAAGGQVVTQPRLRASIAATDEVSLTLAVGRVAQVWQSLRNEEALWARLLPHDILLPGSRIPVADEAGAGIHFEKASVQVNVEAYARRYRRLRSPALPDDIEDAPVLVSAGLEHASGSVVGGEVSVGATVADGALSGSVSLQRHRRNLTSTSYTPAFAKPYAMKLSYTRNTRGVGLVAVGWTRTSGLPWTPGVTGAALHRTLDGSSIYHHRNVIVLGPHNSARLSAYNRLDVSWSGTHHARIFGQRTELRPYLHVFNLLNSRNALRGVVTAVGATPRLEFTPQLPVVPTLGFEWSF